MSAPSRRRRRRGQQGFTLLEVMLTVLVGAMVALPLLAWMVLGTRTQERVVHTSSRIASRNLLAAYFPGDVASSSSASIGGVDCTGGTAAGGTVLLSLLSSGTPATRITYVLAAARPMVAGTGSSDDRSVWRRTCPDGGATVDETPIIDDAIRPAAGWTGSLVCADRSGRTGDTCGQITMSFSLRDAGTVRTTAVRRVGGPQ